MNSFIHSGEQTAVAQRDHRCPHSGPRGICNVVCGLFGHQWDWSSLLLPLSDKSSSCTRATGTHLIGASFVLYFILTHYVYIYDCFIIIFLLLVIYQILFLFLLTIIAVCIRSLSSGVPPSLLSCASSGGVLRIRHSASSPASYGVGIHICSRSRIPHCRCVAREIEG